MTGDAEGRTPAGATGTVAPRVTRRWVQIYTKCLPPDARDARRAEIESDVWEQLADAVTDGQTRTRTQLAVLTRMVTGMPADLVWSTQTRRSMKGNRPMKETLPMKERRLRTVAMICIPLAVTILLVSNLAVDKKSAATANTFWWILIIPVGVLLVGTVGIVALTGAIRERRRSRGAFASTSAHTTD